MITSLFRKSTPINYILVVGSAALAFFLYYIGHSTGDGSLYAIGLQLGLLGIIFASLFIANFIVKKNGLSRDSSYTILFYLLCLLIFPSVFSNPNLVLSSFFILLALRRLISMHSPKSTKEKIFDASMWIFVAALFHFWAIVFIVLVFLSILFHVSRDYRNWILPFLAFAAIMAAFGLFALMFDETLIQRMIAGIKTDFSIDYFTQNTQNLAISIYASIALFFTFSMIFTISGRPLVLQSSYKKIVASFFVGVFIFVVSPDKSNDLLVFTFAPLAFMATSHIELPQNKLRQEMTLAIFIVSAIVLFVVQL